jgi:hypothetical protein
MIHPDMIHPDDGVDAHPLFRAPTGVPVLVLAISLTDSKFLSYRVDGFRETVSEQPNRDPFASRLTAHV